MGWLAGLNPLHAFLVKHFHRRAAEGDGAPGRLIQFRLGDPKGARPAKVRFKTRLAAAAHHQAEQNKLFRLLVESAGRLH